MTNISSHFVVGFDGTTVGPEVKKLMRRYPVAGFILFKRNIESPKQVLELITKLQRLASFPLFFGVDQEGGNVFRLGEPFTQVPPMAVVGEFYKKTKNKKQIRLLGQVMAREMRSVGFNWDFAPVVDVHSNPSNPIIGKRSFGPNPILVSACAENFMKGLHDEGMMSCLKHFPGHGATSLDSHLDLPVVEDAGRLLWKRDFLPYRRLIPKNCVPSIMTAHVVYPELDPVYCATLSSNILVDLLRVRLGYTGLVVSDDFWMKAISDRYGFIEAAHHFFRAEGDIALICKDTEAQIKTLESLEKLAAKSAELKKKLVKSAKRIEKIKRKYFKIGSRPFLDVIGCAEHRVVVDGIICKGNS
ncbi:MAG TPA: beta-N-acetylhexosaminidase [Deltaproteobacteria bacterium]|nr:MAG: hypothetical protein A2048_11060 [Deltaproteobacteria bacterium GWA2_45_12]HBF12175.1 beta-N-acetylhexosaminidase [Deltaproteobacteria bacterium]